LACRLSTDTLDRQNAAIARLALITPPEADGWREEQDDE